MSASGVAAFATLLLPVEGGTFLPADDRWTPPGRWPAADVVLWGAAPRDVGAPRDAARRAARREAAIARLRARPPAGWRVAQVHRLAPGAARRDRIGRTVRRALGGGALVELHRRGARPPARITTVLARAGYRHPSADWHLGPGGALLGFVEGPSGRAVTRAALLGPAGPGTVDHGADGLTAVAGLDLAPRLIARGHDDGVTWSIEQAVAGAPPRELTPALVARLAARWAQLPTSGAPPTAPDQDVAAIVRHLPDRATSLSVVAAAARSGAGGSVLRHGDLWAGNVLVDGDARLVAVVDWDNWHDAAVPGSDLLQLLATERRHEARIGLGGVWRQRPWRDDDVRRHLGDVDPDAAAAAWWATEVAGSLQRDPSLADDERWVTENVDAVLDELSR